MVFSRVGKACFIGKNGKLKSWKWYIRVITMEAAAATTKVRLRIFLPANEFRMVVNHPSFCSIREKHLDLLLLIIS
jgi:hypothetical protein